MWLIPVGAVAVGSANRRDLADRWELALSGAPSVDGTALRLASVERGPLTHTISVESKAVAASRPTLYSPAMGIVTLEVAEGQSVAPGDRLARIESPELANRLEQERAQLAALRSSHERRRLLAQQVRVDHRKALALAKLRFDSASRALARSRDLARQGLVRGEELETLGEREQIERLEHEHLSHQGNMQAAIADFEADDAKRQVERQMLVVAELERKIAALDITAPFRGMVASLQAQDRDAVVRGQALLGLVDLNRLELEIRIPESYAPHVSVGTEAVITLEDEQYAGRVTRVAPEVAGGEVLARVAFTADGHPPLRQNQRVTTRLALGGRSDAIHVPRGPFLQAGGSSVYVHDGASLRRQRVQLGFVGVARVEISEGLEPGEQIVLNNLSHFDDAEQIKVR
ncbi:MAG: HlyD family efflux transporter periplasmic adaptor subunit [Myxococcales bacterium FL481]|nr:MAG: HlyD family efflux transporter periplasmic adaptor subunit [Myxococcales bacterium FL481]